MNRLLVLGLAVILAGSIARGEIVINNLANSSSSFNGLGAGFEGVAVKFTAAQSFNQFADIKLNLIKFPSGSTGTFTVTLHANIEGAGTDAKPNATVLDTVGTGNWNDLSDTVDSFVQFNNVGLGSTRAAGDYWLAVTSSAPANTQRFSYGANASSQYLNAYYDGSSWANFSTIPFLANNIGASITTAVPEPGTLILGGIATLCGGGGFWWKRRRKAVSAAAAENEPAV